MLVKDLLLALLVVVIWGINFVFIKIGLQEMPPLLLAGFRFFLVAFPAIFFIKPPQLPIKWILIYGVTISFGQFAFLFFAIKLGMPAGLASLLLQAQAFFTILIGALLLGDKLKWNHILGLFVAILGIALLAQEGMEDQSTTGITLLTLILTLAAALSWALGNIANKVIMRDYKVEMMRLIIWSATVPLVHFFLCSWIFEGKEAIVSSLLNISMPTIISILYLSILATLVGYSIWGNLLNRYETWRIAPLSLLVPVVGVISAGIILDEKLTLQQCIGALIIVVGLLINIFGSLILNKVIRP